MVSKLFYLQNKSHKCITNSYSQNTNTPTNYHWRKIHKCKTIHKYVCMFARLWIFLSMNWLLNLHLNHCIWICLVIFLNFPARHQFKIFFYFFYFFAVIVAGGTNFEPDKPWPFSLCRCTSCYGWPKYWISINIIYRVSCLNEVVQ